MHQVRPSAVAGALYPGQRQLLSNDAMPCLQRPPATLIRARNIARKEGLHHAYTGNVHNKEGDTTVCPVCHATLIERDGYQIVKYRLAPQRHCPDCETAVAGRFAAQAGNFGRKRIPLAINA